MDYNHRFSCRSTKSVFVCLFFERTTLHHRTFSCWALITIIISRCVTHQPSFLGRKTLSLHFLTSCVISSNRGGGIFFYKASLFGFIATVWILFSVLSSCFKSVQVTKREIDPCHILLSNQSSAGVSSFFGGTSVGAGFSMVFFCCHGVLSNACFSLT